MSEYRRDYYISEHLGSSITLSPVAETAGRPTFPVIDQLNLCTSGTSYTSPCEFFHPVTSCHVYEVIIREKS